MIYWTDYTFHKAIWQLSSAPAITPHLPMTSSFNFPDWVQVFGAETLTAALLDRLTHHAHILEFIGESYRFRQRMQRETEGKDNG